MTHICDEDSESPPRIATSFCFLLSHIIYNMMFLKVHTAVSELTET